MQNTGGALVYLLPQEKEAICDRQGGLIVAGCSLVSLITGISIKYHPRCHPGWN